MVSLSHRFFLVPTQQYKRTPIVKNILKSCDSCRTSHIYSANSNLIFGSSGSLKYFLVILYRSCVLILLNYLVLSARLHFALPQSHLSHLHVFCIHLGNPEIVICYFGSNFGSFIQLYEFRSHIPHRAWLPTFISGVSWFGMNSSIFTVHI